FQVVHRALDVLDPGAQRGGLAVDRGLGGAQEVRDGDAGDLDGVLHGEEEAGAGALVDAHLEHVLTVEGDLAAGDLVLRVAGDRVGEGGLAGPVGAHDGVGLARPDGEVDALEDLLGALRGLDGGVEVLDLQDRHRWFSLTRVSGGVVTWDGAPRGGAGGDQVAGAAVGSTRISPLLSSMRTGNTRTGRTAGSCRGRPVTRSNWLPCFQHSMVQPSTSPSLSAISSCEQMSSRAWTPPSSSRTRAISRSPMATSIASPGARSATVATGTKASDISSCSGRARPRWRPRGARGSRGRRSAGRSRRRSRAPPDGGARSRGCRGHGGR